MFKKIFSILLLSLVILPTANAQEANIYITQLKADKSTYNVGDIVKGSFTISNTADVAQSDIIIKASTYFKSGSQVALANETVLMKDLYIKLHSKQNIPFSYSLPQDIAGDSMLVIRAYTSDGTIKGEQTIPLSINGKSKKAIVGIDKSSLVLNDKDFELQVGPTVTNKDNVEISFSANKLSDSYKVNPVITLYNRTYGSEPLKTLPQDSITIVSGNTYKIKLPTDLEPLVYEGVLSFESDSAQIQPIAFRYIIKGDIGTIINASTDTLGGKRGDVISVKVSYGGTPYAFNINNSSTTNSELSASPAIISVILLNDEGKTVGSTDSQIDLRKTADIDVPVTLTDSSKKMNISVTMIKDGKILSEYKVKLPAMEENNNFTKIIYSVVYLILGIIILTLLSIYKNNRSRNILIGLIIFIVLILGVFTYQKANALTVLKQTTRAFSDISLDPIKINSITSPFPSDVQSYAPGESFDLKFNATFGACTNKPFSFTAYGPSPSSWWTKTASQYLSVVGNASLGSIYGIWSGLGGKLIFTSDRNGISSSGTLLKDSGYYSSNGNGHWFGIPTYYIQSNGSYTMPTTPGIYDFVFMTANSSSGTFDEGYRIVSQQVCVRGAGLCFDEAPTATTTVATTTTDNGSTTNSDITTNPNQTCGVSTITEGNGLTAGSANLCNSNSLISTNFNTTFPSIINPKVWSWQCVDNSSGSKSNCSARCAPGLNYCSDTNTCTASACANGDMCPYIEGIQKQSDPIYKDLHCTVPTLKMTVKFDKPYANETTSKCGVNWSAIPNPSGLQNEETKCLLDSTQVNSTANLFPVNVGNHKLSCVTTIHGDDPASDISTATTTKEFKCSRVPVSNEQ